MINYRVFELLHECKMVPSPIYEAFDGLVSYVDALLTGRAEWEETNLVSGRMRTIFGACQVLYIEDVVKHSVWTVFVATVREFYGNFHSICETNNAKLGDWSWMEGEL